MRLQGQRGYTLLELVIVISVLALIAAIAVPASQPGDEQGLDYAADEVAAAMRFARTESMRTAIPHGFNQESSAKRIRVFRLDMGTSPPTRFYDVYHPISKQLYDIQLDLDPFGSVESIARTAVFRGTCNLQGNVYFDASGVPWCADPETVLLETFELDMRLGVDERTVSVDAVTGRTTVQ